MKKIISLIAIAAVLFACSKQESELPEDQGLVPGMIGEEKATLNVTTTFDPQGTTYTSAVAGGIVTVTGTGSINIVEKGVCYSTSPVPTISSPKVTAGPGPGTFTVNLTGLDTATTYYIRAYATKKNGVTKYGNQLSFTTLAPFTCGNTITDSDGNVYTTVLIGDQCWMAENLKVGTMINSSQNMADNGTIEKYSYNNDPANDDIYGGLYQWGEAMQYSTAPGARGICPQGWHIATDEEWKVLEGNVDSQYGVGDPEWDGNLFRGFDAGKNLKSSSGWLNSGNGTNSFGFGALPGGQRIHPNGGWDGLGTSAMFWTSSNWIYDGYANYRTMWDSRDEMKRYGHIKTSGLSVRCVMD